MTDQTKEWQEEQERRARFHYDPRVRDAQKRYRAEVRAGISEAVAWQKANATYEQVRKELGYASGEIVERADDNA